MPPTPISPEKFEKILEVNAKAVELQTIINGQYEEMIEKLDNISEKADKRKEKIDGDVAELKNEQAELKRGIEKNNTSIVAINASILKIEEITQKISSNFWRLVIALATASGILTIIGSLIISLLMKK
jgi:hypothetical protein